MKKFKSNEELAKYIDEQEDNGMSFLEIMLELQYLQNKREYKKNLKEGLISTAPIGKTITSFKEINSNFKISTKNNKIKIDIKNSNESEFKQLLLKANTLGWFPSVILSKAEQMKYNYDLIKGLDFNNFIIIFEAKFDRLIDKVPEKLYHITRKIIWQTKISKIGLTPRSKAKIGEHPERVYFTTNISSAERLYKNMVSKGSIESDISCVLLEISTNMISGNYLKLRIDPNYPEGGLYTQNNIPKNAIKLLKDLN